MGAARIQEEMQGDHTFPDLAEKEEGWGGGGTVRTRVMRAWAARRLGRAREEAAENSERGQVVGVHQARQES